jgi:hypothetical protein
VLQEQPPVERWAENLLFALYDPGHDVGLWLHLGTMPTNWELWEDRALVALPAGAGALTQRSYFRTPPEQRPAAANLAFECVEPYGRWRITFDGVGVLTPYETMRRQLVTDGPREPFTIDLDVECTTPVWDLHAAAAHETGKGSMQAQSWAREHYEQLYRATGTVTLPTGSVAFEGTGWRDHSRGPRGADNSATWGGHVIMGAYLPGSGRAVGLCRYYHPQGGVTLEAGYVVVDQTLHHAQVLDASRLTELRKAGEELRFGLQSDLGELRIDAVTTTSLFTMLRRSVHYYGIDPTGEFGMVYVLNWARFDWDGEEAYLYVERADPLAITD